MGIEQRIRPGDQLFIKSFLADARLVTRAKENAAPFGIKCESNPHHAIGRKSRAGLLITEKTFAEAAEQFLKEYETITKGERDPRWVEGHAIRLRVHLLPFFGPLGLSQVTAAKAMEYRVHRMTSRVDKKTGEAKRPSRSILHDEFVTLRQVLKTAIRHSWLSHLPDLSPPYKTQGKIIHRPWFSPEEYK